jgi:sugar phosphate isomerase/epimerase
MKTIKGPAIFLAQFMGDDVPFDNLEPGRLGIRPGLQAIQLPCDPRLFDLDRRPTARPTATTMAGMLASHGLQITELSTTCRASWWPCIRPTMQLFDGFAAPHVRGNPAGAPGLGHDQLLRAARASKRLGLAAHVSFSGALAWPYIYPWPQRPAGLVEEAFAELGRRWLPILDAFEDAGVDICYELHPGEDLHDGVSFERFLDAVGGHRRANILYDPSHFVLQQLDYLAFIDIYHERIKAFHVKDAEFRPNGRQGVYGGYLGWQERAGASARWATGRSTSRRSSPRWRNTTIRGWAVLEWECASSIPKTARAKARTSSAATSSAWPSGRLTISPAAARTCARSAR